jgi:hypothetical protein
MPLDFSVPSTYAIDAVGAKSVVENGSGSWKMQVTVMMTELAVSTK